MKFSIRDLLLVTVIVALAVGWWVDHRGQGSETEKLTRNSDPFWKSSPGAYRVVSVTTKADPEPSDDSVLTYHVPGVKKPAHRRGGGTV